MRRLLTQVGSKIGSRQDVTHGWLYDFTMTLESIPNFTEPAAKLWRAIPADIKMLLALVQNAARGVFPSTVPVRKIR